jgi:hypothetical protein
MIPTTTSVIAMGPARPILSRPEPGLKCLRASSDKLWGSQGQFRPGQAQPNRPEKFRPGQSEAWAYPGQASKSSAGPTAITGFRYPQAHTPDPPSFTSHDSVLHLHHSRILQNLQPQVRYLCNVSHVEDAGGRIATTPSQSASMYCNNK